MAGKLKDWARTIKRDAYANHLGASDFRTPGYAKMLAAEAPPAVDLQKIQRWRKRMLLGMFSLTLLPALFVGSYWWPGAQAFHDSIEWVGIVLIFMCIFGRTWCTLYIGGRKKRELVTLGPYPVCRNPLYLFTVLGAFGIAAQSGSLIFASAVAVGTFAIFHRVVIREEAFLAGAFGVEFARYAEHVPRFLPRLSSWKDAQELTISPRLTIRTFVHTTLSLLSIPAAEVLEALQERGMIAVFMRLP